MQVGQTRGMGEKIRMVKIYGDKLSEPMFWLYFSEAIKYRYEEDEPRVNRVPKQLEPRLSVNLFY